MLADSSEYTLKYKCRNTEACAVQNIFFGFVLASAEEPEWRVLWEMLHFNLEDVFRAHYVARLQVENSEG